MTAPTMSDQRLYGIVSDEALFNEFKAVAAQIRALGDRVERLNSIAQNVMVCTPEEINEYMVAARQVSTELHRPQEILDAFNRLGQRVGEFLSRAQRLTPEQVAAWEAHVQATHIPATPPVSDGSGAF